MDDTAQQLLLPAPTTREPYVYDPTRDDEDDDKAWKQWLQGVDLTDPDEYGGYYYYPKSKTPYVETEEQRKRREADEAVRARYRTIPVVETPFCPRVTPECFIALSGFLLEEHSTEIGGFAYWNPETNTIDWIHRDRLGEGQGSTWNGGTAHGMMACLMERGQNANVQWHSHPHFGCFFSPTDMQNQMELVERSMIAPTGFIIFVVVDGLEWKVARISWQDYVLTGIEEGYVHIGDQPLSYHRPPIKYSGSYTTYSKTGDKKNVYYEKERKNSKGETLTRVQAMYMGMWSADEEDYDLLFDMFGVERFNWLALYRRIDDEFPNSYYEIVDIPGCWQAVDIYLKDLAKAAAEEAADHDNTNPVTHAE